MTKEQISEELKMAYAKKKWQDDMFNYVDKDFIDSVSYEMKATESRISALINMYDKAEETPKEKASKFWSGYILSCMQVPVGVKKETAVCKQIGF